MQICKFDSLFSIEMDHKICRSLCIINKSLIWKYWQSEWRVDSLLSIDMLMTILDNTFIRSLCYCALQNSVQMILQKREFSMNFFTLVFPNFSVSKNVSFTNKYLAFYLDKNIILNPRTIRNIIWQLQYNDGDINIS